MADNLEPNDPMDQDLNPEEEMIARDTHEPVKKTRARKTKDKDANEQSREEEQSSANVEEIYPGGAPHATRPEDMNESGENDENQSEGTYSPV